MKIKVVHGRVGGYVFSKGRKQEDSIVLILEEGGGCTKECKRKIKITLTELLKREKANAVKEQAEEIMRWL